VDLWARRKTRALNSAKTRLGRSFSALQPEKERECQPDFVLSGHIHEQPYDGNFAGRIDRTWCFNPGRPALDRAIPNHILLDTAKRTATWYATPNVGRQPIKKEISLNMNPLAAIGTAWVGWTASQ